MVGPIFRRTNLLTQISGATSVELLVQDLREACSNPGVSTVLLTAEARRQVTDGLSAMRFGSWRWHSRQLPGVN